ncbi:hypothetical protein FHT21_001706 [Pedobacter sp. SG908]|nr:hypothetical protein [Pedobacter sp. SG908]
MSKKDCHVVPLREIGAGTRNDDEAVGMTNALERNEEKTENFKLKTANCIKIPPFLSI